MTPTCETCDTFSNKKNISIQLKVVKLVSCWPKVAYHLKPAFYEPLSQKAVVTFGLCMRWCGQEPWPLTFCRRSISCCLALRTARACSCSNSSCCLLSAASRICWREKKRERWKQRMNRENESNDQSLLKALKCPAAMHLAAVKYRQNKSPCTDLHSNYLCLKVFKRSSLSLSLFFK